MALKDRILDDICRVFINDEHFASWHTWNGKRFHCVTDEEAALKRKNNNVVDLSWDNNSRQILLYVRKEDFPGVPMPNDHGVFDNKAYKILQVTEDMGMLCVSLLAYDPKGLVT